jgi:hypothetical protein
VVGGASVKRTDLEVLRGFRDLLSFAWAAAKSAVREGLLGDVRVGEVGVLLGFVEELMSNWDVRSASWERRRGSCDDIALRVMY